MRAVADGDSVSTSVGAGMGNSWSIASERVVWPATLSDDEPPNCQENNGNKATPVSGDVALMQMGVTDFQSLSPFLHEVACWRQPQATWL